MTANYRTYEVNDNNYEQKSCCKCPQWLSDWFILTLKQTICSQILQPILNPYCASSLERIPKRRTPLRSSTLLTCQTHEHSSNSLKLPCSASTPAPSYEHHHQRSQISNIKLPLDKAGGNIHNLSLASTHGMQDIQI